MRILVLSLFMLSVFVNSQAQTLIDGQNYSKTDAIIGASILGATFITMELYGNQMTYGQRSITAMSGIAISAGYSLFKSTKFSKKIAYKIKRKIKLNRNKSVSKPLLCEK